MLPHGRLADASFSLTRWQHSFTWNDVVSAILKSSSPKQSMRIYLGNIPAKFHPVSIWNDGNEWWRGRSNKKKKNKKNNKMSSDMRSVPDPKTSPGGILIGSERGGDGPKQRTMQCDDELMELRCLHTEIAFDWCAHRITITPPGLSGSDQTPHGEVVWVIGPRPRNTQASTGIGDRRGHVSMEWEM